MDEVVDLLNEILDELRTMNEKLDEIRGNEYDDGSLEDIFDKLDEKILKNFNGIHRNYLMKEVAYKTNVRLMTVVIKQSELIINFDKSAEDYDTKNLLKERAGYQNQNYYYSLHLLH